MENEIEAGRFHAGQREAERTTLHAALDRYLAQNVPLKKGILQNTGIVRAWQRWPLAKRALAAVRASDVAASDWGMESLANPVSLLKKPALPTGRERRLVADEEDRLLAACAASKSRWLLPMVRLALGNCHAAGTNSPTTNGQSLRRYCPTSRAGFLASRIAWC